MAHTIRGVWNNSTTNPPGDQRGSRDNHDAKVQTDTGDSFVFDFTEYKYIDWTDISIPQSKIEISDTQQGIRDASRTTLEITNAPDVMEMDITVKDNKKTDGHNTIFENESTCPIPTCRKRAKKLKHHCWDYHLPFIFKDKLEENDAEFQKRRGEALSLLANWICNKKSTIFDLVRYIYHIPDFIPNN